MVHFEYSFSIAWIFGFINQIIEKTQSLQILIRSQLQAKHLVITQGKRRWGEGGPLLFFATKCRGRATYYLNVEAICFCKLGKAIGAAS